MHLFLADLRIVLLESAALHLGQWSRHPSAFARLFGNSRLGFDSRFARRRRDLPDVRCVHGRVSRESGGCQFPMKLRAICKSFTGGR